MNGQVYRFWAFWHFWANSMLIHRWQKSHLVLSSLRTDGDFCHQGFGHRNCPTCNCIFSAFLVKNLSLNLMTQNGLWKIFGYSYAEKVGCIGKKNQYSFAWYISSLDIHWIEFSIDFWKLVLIFDAKISTRTLMWNNWLKTVIRLQWQCQCERWLWRAVTDPVISCGLFVFLVFHLIMTLKF
jgi:hypothetical protein